MVNSIADAWCRGMTAGADGWSRRDNPYSANSQLAESWYAGWLMGHDLCSPHCSADRQRRSGDGEVVAFPAEAVRGRRANWS